MQRIITYLKSNISSSFPRKIRFRFLIASFIFFALFIVLTLIVRTDSLRPFDFDSTVKTQAKIPLIIDPFFSWLSVFGRFETTLVILIIALFLKKKFLGIIAFFLFGLAHIVEIIGKISLSQPGPPHMFLRTHELAQEFPGFYIHTQASYPSGHSMRTIFLSVLIGILIFINRKIPTKIKIIIYIALTAVSVLMLISRVSLGEHWTTDVVGGAFLGASFAFISLIFL